MNRIGVTSGLVVGLLLPVSGCGSTVIIEELVVDAADAGNVEPTTGDAMTSDVSLDEGSNPTLGDGGSGSVDGHAGGETGAQIDATAFDAFVSDASPDSGYFWTDGGSPTRTCPVLATSCTAAAPCSDLPAAPILDGQTPANAATYFAAAASSAGGPCILEPSDGTLIPQNWVRPRVRFAPATGQNLFEIRVHSGTQSNDLVVFTTQQTWILPADLWDALRASSVDQDIAVTVTGVNASAAAVQPAASKATFRIAPATTGGSILYFAAAGECVGQAWLEGLRVGDETVSTVLTPPQVQWYTPFDGWGDPVQDGGGVTDCIGCHSAIPDGDGGVVESVAFANSWDPPGELGWPGTVASIDPTSVGAIPSWVTPSGKQAFDQPWLGLAAFSAGDWQTEHVALSSYGQQLATALPYEAADTAYPNQHASLAWFDLSSPGPGLDAGFSGLVLGADLYADLGTSWGFLNRTGDSNGVELPSWSHDGKTVVYVSTNAGQDGRVGSATQAVFDGGIADLYTVPYNDRQGGTATPVAGASDPSWSEFYPSFSANDAFIAFARAPSTEDMYYNSHDEVWVVPSGGATAAQRLVANDPPACSGSGSPGVTNSWPRWSPDVETCPNGLTYYWIVFSPPQTNLWVSHEGSGNAPRRWNKAISACS